MTIPTRAEAAKFLRDLNPPDWLLAHSGAVADIAAFLGERVAERGHAIDVTLLETAALLHDVGKALPHDTHYKDVGHAIVGAEWLVDHGFSELAATMRGHPVTSLGNDDYYAIWSRSATVEERALSYSDKRAMADLVSMKDRFERWIRKNGDNEMMRNAWQRAEALEADMCGAAGVTPVEVQRLRWAEDALAVSAAAE